MLTLNFTTPKLEDYYNNRFHKDLREFFNITKVDNIDVVDEDAMEHLFTSYSNNLKDIFRPAQPLPMIIPNGKSPIEEPIVMEGSITELEAEVLFVALISFMVSTEKAIVSRNPASYNESEMALCMNAFGFPWIQSIHRIDLYNFLSSVNSIKEEFSTMEEVEILRDAMSIVEPFMLDKLMLFLKTWDNGSFYERNRNIVNKLSFRIENCISRELLSYYRRFYKYTGLMGLQTPSLEDYKNYKQQFYKDFKEYFRSTSTKDGYPQLLSVYYDINHRWQDGNPGSSIINNLNFTCFFLYMTIAQQSILEYAEEAEEDFHKCTGWPLISLGPGAGPYLHPLIMLEKSGLSPLKYEAPILLEFAKQIFQYLRQDLNPILNGKEASMKDVIAGKRFLSAITGKKNLIKKYLDEEETSVLDLLSKWQMHPDDKWRTLLEKEGIRIIKEFK